MAPETQTAVRESKIPIAVRVCVQPASSIAVPVHRSVVPSMAHVMQTAAMALRVSILLLTLSDVPMTTFKLDKIIKVQWASCPENVFGVCGVVSA
jgi:hypothetical protein